MKVLIGANPMGLEEGIADLQKAYPDIEFEHCPTRDGVGKQIGDADVYMGWLKREDYLVAKKIKWIQSPSSGINYYLDIPELVKSDVLLTSARGTHGAAVADSAMGMILAMTRGIRAAVLDQPKKEWNNRAIRPTMRELTGSVIGIIGCGAIGRAMAQRAKAFDMRVIGLDLNPDLDIPHVDDLWGLDHLHELLAVADYVVVLLPYTPQTVNFISTAELARMKSDALLVAMSRGGIVDEDALVQALKAGQIGGAALDVFKPEPLSQDSELWTLPNVLVTPHIAGGTQHEGKYVMEIFKENLERFISGSLPLRNQVDKEAGF